MSDQVRAEHLDATAMLPDVAVTRRISIIWGLLFFNALGTIPTSRLSPPRSVAQILTMSALGLAIVMALALNRRLLVCPNVVLVLTTVLAVVALMTSIRGMAGVGAILRSVRLIGFLSVLWLLTPWFGRRDLLLARCHLRALVAVCGSVVLGVLVAPSIALGGGPTGRLTGVLWPIPPPQVAEYAGVLAGMAVVLWLSEAMAQPPAFLLALGGMAMLLLTQTRTALIALVVGVTVGGLTLVLRRRRVRRAIKVMLIILPLAAAAFAPLITNWYHRDQSSNEISGLTGRKHVWDMVVTAPRPGFNRWFGFGLSDKSFGGLPIDSTWLAVFQDEGLVGDALVAATMLYLLLVATIRPAGPRRAMATFLVVYVILASYTEVGLGDVSPYLLHAAVAASLLTVATQGRDAPTRADVPETAVGA